MGKEVYLPTSNFEFQDSEIKEDLLIVHRLNLVIGREKSLQVGFTSWTYRTRFVEATIVLCLIGFKLFSSLLKFEYNLSMYLDDKVRQKIREIISQAMEELSFPSTEIKIEYPQGRYGDYTALVAFDLASKVGRPPQEVAQAIVKKLENYHLGEWFSQIEVAGDGFINFSLKDELLLVEMTEIYKQKENYGRRPTKKKKVLIEYSQPNPNKPMHIGHSRNNFLGMSVGNLFKAIGYQVKLINWINDRGIHICKALWSYQKEKEKQNGKLKIEEKPDHFVGKCYILGSRAYKEDPKAKEEIEQMLRDWEEGKPRIRKLWREMVDLTYQGWKQTYQRQGCYFDKWFYESDLYQRGKELIFQGLEKGHFYRHPNGSIRANLEKFNLPEKVLLRSDGTSIYITGDLALAEEKEHWFSPDLSVYCVGVDQQLYFQQLFAIIQLLGIAPVEKLFHLSYGMVNLKTGKMSSREGTVVYADDLMDELKQKALNKIKVVKISKINEEEKDRVAEKVAQAAFKYGILKYTRNSEILFDPQESLSLEGNSGPYLLYTYTRCQSVLEKSGTTTLEMRLKPRLNPLERSISRHLSRFPYVVEMAASEFAPSVLAKYLFELANSYNSFYNTYPILKAKKADRNLRLLITQTTANVLKTGLALLGIEVVDRM